MAPLPFRRRIGIGAALSAISVGFQLIAFLVNNMLAHLLGATAFAQYAVVTTDYNLFAIAAEFAVGTTVLSLFAGRLQQRSLVWLILKLKWLLAAVAAVGMFLFAFWGREQAGLTTPVATMSLGFLLSPTLIEWFFLGNRLWKKLLRMKLFHAATYLGGGALLYTTGFESITAVCAMVVLAPIPALLYGLSHFPSRRKRVGFKNRCSEKRMGRLIVQKSFPVALSTLGSFLYLPILIYAMNSSWSGGESKAAFTAAHRLILVLTGFVTQFFTSEQIHYDRTAVVNSRSKWRRVAAYTSLSALVLAPLWLLAPKLLQLLFFGLNWSAEMVVIGETTLRLLLWSILLQFMRLPALVGLMADRRYTTVMAVVLIGGVLNGGVLWLATRFAPNQIAVAGLTGDLVATALLLSLFFLSQTREGKERQMLSS